MPYDAVLFDFDGVVIEPPIRRRLSDAVERTYDRLDRSGPIAKTLQAFASGDVQSIVARCQQLEIDPDDFCTQAGREFVRTQLDNVERGVRSIYDDVCAVRSFESPLGIVSDNHPTVVTAVLHRIGLYASFETVYGCPLTPEGLSRRNPDPQNIENALSTLEADTALYVGDRPIDVQAAHNAGIDAALLVREETADSETRHGKTAPEYRISSVADVTAILE